MKVVFLIAACASVLAVFLICVFLFANGLPAMGKIGPLKFLFGTEWRPTNDKKYCENRCTGRNEENDLHGLFS